MRARASGLRIPAPQGYASQRPGATQASSSVLREPGERCYRSMKRNHETESASLSGMCWRTNGGGRIETSMLSEMQRRLTREAKVKGALHFTHSLLQFSRVAIAGWAEKDPVEDLRRRHAPRETSAASLRVRCVLRVRTLLAEAESSIPTRYYRSWHNELLMLTCR